VFDVLVFDVLMHTEYERREADGRAFSHIRVDRGEGPYRDGALDRGYM